MKATLRALLGLAALGGALCLGPAGPSPASAPPAVGAPAREAAGRLVGQLGSPDFAAREEAEHLLAGCDAAAPALRRAARSKALEVRLRARRALAALERRRVAALLRSGEVDLAVELFVAASWRDDEDEPAWRAVARLGKALVARERGRFRGDPFNPPRGAGYEAPFGDFGRYFGQPGLRRVTAARASTSRGEESRICLIRAQRVEVWDFATSSLVVSSGGVGPAPGRRWGGPLGGCVVLANGPVEVGSVVGCVVICDGRFKAAESVAGSIVVAREGADVGGVSHTLVATCGRATFAGSSLPPHVTLRQKDPLPLGFVRFFDPARLGVVVAPGPSGVRVKEAAAGKPFARAGLCPGDLVLAVGDRPTPTPEDFRRALRRAVALGEDAVLSVRRGASALTVSVRLGP